MAKFVIGDILIFEYTILKLYLKEHYVKSSCKIVYLDDNNYYFQPINGKLDEQFSVTISDIDNKIGDKYTLSTSTLFKKL